MRHAKVLVVLLVLLVGWVVIASRATAADLLWDRNGESDMKDYQVYACFTPNCVIVKSAGTFQATVPQVPAGTVPKYTIDLTNKEGALAVSARDQSTNESGLSVPVPFDVRAPAVPVNPRLQ